MKRKVEIFIAGCPMCEPVVKMVNELSCSNCEIITYDLVKQFDDQSCLKIAQEYGVTRIPAVAVNGKLLNCCEKGITKEDLIGAGIGQ